MIDRAIPYGKQSIDQTDIDAVVDVLKSDFLTQGPAISGFEEAFAKYIGVKYAVAVSNGTAALHLSALALGVEPGEKVITTPITFAASANCVRYAGGEVVFADIDPETYLIDLDQVEKLLAGSPKGTFKGIIPVDFAGRAVELEKLRKLADKYECWIIEDACHAPGGWFKDSKGKKQFCGNGNYADLAIFSFHPVKHIAAGEGGMITTNDKSLYEKLITLRTHGITKDKNIFQNSPETALFPSSIAIIEEKDVQTDKVISGVEDLERYPGWYYEMQELGYNYRLTDLQAALANSQLKRANTGLSRRREIAKNYFEAFKDKSFIIGQSEVVEGHAYHLYVIEVENRKELYEYLRTNNIFAQIHYVPVHLMPYYKQYGWNNGDMPVAEKYYSRCISLPMFPALTNEEQKFVIDCINSFFK